MFKITSKDKVEGQSLAFSNDLNVKTYTFDWLFLLFTQNKVKTSCVSQILEKKSLHAWNTLLSCMHHGAFKEVKNLNLHSIAIGATSHWAYFAFHETKKFLSYKFDLLLYSQAQIKSKTF